MPCFKPTTNPQLDAERTALGKISPQVDAEKVLNASPFTPQSKGFYLSALWKQLLGVHGLAEAGDRQRQRYSPLVSFRAKALTK